MFTRPPGHYKTKSTCLQPTKGWEMECYSISSREQTSNSMQTEEQEHKNRLIQIKNTRENILPPKNGYKNVGFKNHGRKKSREAMKSELPSLSPYQITQLNPLLIRYENYLTPPPSNRPGENKNRLSGNGYHMGPLNKLSESKESSRSHRQGALSRSKRDKPEGNSLYELAMSRINYWPNLDGISEESPQNTDGRQRDMMEQNGSRRTPRYSSVPTQSRGEEVNARNVAVRFGMLNELKEEGNSVKRSARIKREMNLEYFTVDKTGNMFKDAERIERWDTSMHPNINSLLGTESAMDSTRNKLDGSKDEEKRFHKDSFMKMIYKGLGKGANGALKNKYFEQMCEEKRAAFRKSWRT